MLWKTVALAAVGTSVISSLWSYPHSLAYYNEIAGGTRNGYRYGGDSSYDWGQDLIYLEEWLARHDAKCTTEIVCFALYDLSDVGFGCKDVANLPSRPWHVVTHLEADRPEWLAVSTSSMAYLCAIAERKPKVERTGLENVLLRLRDISPDDRAGVTILIYRMRAREARLLFGSGDWMTRSGSGKNLLNHVSVHGEGTGDAVLFIPRYLDVG